MYEKKRNALVFVFKLIGIRVCMQNFEFRLINLLIRSYSTKVHTINYMAAG